MSDRIELFRYRSINTNLYQELELSELFAADPTYVNDPFDCQIDANSALARAIGLARSDKRKQILKTIQRDFDESPPQKRKKGICCFSLKKNSMTMWSHYAESHSGVCLKYQFDLDFFDAHYDYDQVSSSEPFFVALAKVKYGRQPFIDWLRDGNLNEPIADSPTASAAAKLLVMKSEQWSYEEEVRLVMSQPGPLMLEDDAIAEVTFGLKTPEAAKRAIKSVAKRKNPNIVFYQCVPDASNDFSIGFIREVY